MSVSVRLLQPPTERRKRAQLLILINVAEQG